MSNIDNAKKAMGWLDPRARAACGNCSFGKLENETAPFEFGKPASVRCSKGAFYTQRFAICDQYAPMLLPGGSVPK